MSYLIATLQLLGVGIGAFAVFSLLLSYSRYRKMQLVAEDKADGLLSATEAVFLILGELRLHLKQGQMGLVRVAVSPSIPESNFKEFLRLHVRKDDLIFQLEGGAFLILVQCPNENLPAVRDRLHQLMIKEGYHAGHLGIMVPEFDAQDIFNWIEGKTLEVSPLDWSLYPEEWPFQPDALPPTMSVDILTGVLKTDRVPRALRRKLAHLRRSGRRISLVRVDVDELAAYNRAHGRGTGDLILKTVAGLLMENCRESDLIGRLEEDAFVLAMEGEADDILGSLWRMSNLIKNTPLRMGENDIHFSAGFGLASMPSDGRNPQVLMANAECAMQEAKKRGRGVCVAFHASMKIPRSRQPGAGKQTETF